MKSETYPITNNEWVIRLVWKDRVRPDRTPIIGISSFQPREDEHTGISFFRQACQESPTDVLKSVAKETNRDSNALVEVSVNLIQSLGLTVISDPIPGVMAMSWFLRSTLKLTDPRKNRLRPGF